MRRLRANNKDWKGETKTDYIKDFRLQKPLKEITEISKGLFPTCEVITKLRDKVHDWVDLLVEVNVKTNEEFKREAELFKKLADKFPIELFHYISVYVRLGDANEEV